MKTIICENSQLAEKAADFIIRVLKDKPEAVLALACGQTMKPVWAQLADAYAKGAVNFEKARVLCVTELIGVREEQSCRYALENELLRRLNIRSDHCFFPNPDAPEDYDRLIESLGCIDLAVLGIGENCHVGYNEPGTLFDSMTHVQKLTDRTKRQLLKRGFVEADMPQKAVTMGIKNLTDAGEILVIAAGDKAGAVYQMVYAKTTPYIPAAYLQIPLEVTVLLDTEAARELETGGIKNG